MFSEQPHAFSLNEKGEPDQAGRRRREPLPVVVRTLQFSHKMLHGRASLFAERILALIVSAALIQIRGERRSTRGWVGLDGWAFRRRYPQAHFASAIKTIQPLEQIPLPSFQERTDFRFVARHCGESHWQHADPAMDAVQRGGMLQGLEGNLRIDHGARQFVRKNPTHGDPPGRRRFGYARQVSTAADTQWI